MVSPLTEYILLEEEYSTHGINSSMDIHPQFDGFRFQYHSFSDEDYATVILIRLNERAISQYLPKNSAHSKSIIEPWLKGNNTSEQISNTFFYDLKGLITN